MPAISMSWFSDDLIVTSAWTSLISFSSTFAKLRKATNGFVMSVRAWNNLAPNGQIFMKIYIWGFFENTSRNLKFHWNRTRITGTLHEDQYTCLSHLAHSFLEWEMFQTKVVEKIKIHILCSVTFFGNRAVYEKMWKSIVERGKPRMTIWCTRIACWIPASQ